MMKSNQKYRVCVATSTRADWGLLMPLCRALRSKKSVELNILATNMHLIEKYGHTVDEILAEGFEVAAEVPMEIVGDDEASRAIAMSRCMEGSASALAQISPDAIIILGDRYEMLAIASVAAIMHIPIIHIAGGEITIGAIDDSIRHAITKLSTLHLTATEEYRQRVIQLGESPKMVVNTGAIGVWNAFNTRLMTARELEKDLNIDFSSRRVAIVTYHPATNDNESPVEQLQKLLKALDCYPQLMSVITAPNNDAGGESLFPVLESYAAAHPERVRLVRSLGMRRYQSLLQLADVVIGNSSSGIVEAPSAGCPTVDIGIRQKGRLAGPSVLHCKDSFESICSAIKKSLSPKYQEIAKRKENPYYKDNTLAIMTTTIMRFLRTLPIKPKEFYDLPQ